MYRRVFLGIVLALALVTSAQAQLSCGVKSTCGGEEAEIFRISGLGNAHAALPGAWGGYSLCCEEAGPLSGSCNVGGVEGEDFDYLMFLSDPDNAHATWAETKGSLTNPVCLSFIGGKGVEVDCELRTDPEPCSADYICIATLSSRGNAHVAGCSQSAYNNKICCKAKSDTTVPFLKFVPPTPANMDVIWENIMIVNVLSEKEDLKKGTCFLTDAKVYFPDPPPPLTGSFSPLNFPRTPMEWEPSTPRNCQYEFNNLIDGRYEFYVVGKDSTNNEGKTVMRTVTIWADLPESVITYPSDGRAYRETTWLKKIEGTAKDMNEGMAGVLLYISTKLWGGSSWKTVYWDGTSWSEGEKYIILITNPVGQRGNPATWGDAFAPPPQLDWDGNYTVRTRGVDTKFFQQYYPTEAVFGIDRKNPEIPLITNPQRGGSTGNRRFNYQGAVQDVPRDSLTGYASGIQKVEYRVCPDENQCHTSIPWTEVSNYHPNLLPQRAVGFSFTAMLSIGMNRVEVRAIDAAGNVGLAKADNIVYDTSWPEVIIRGPDISSYYYNHNTWKNTDPVWGTTDHDGFLEIVDVVNVSIQRVNDSFYWNNETRGWQAERYWIRTMPQGGSYAVWDWPTLPAMGIYFPSDSGRYRIAANATDDTKKSTIDSMIVVYDRHLPVPWIEPLPEWTNNRSILVSWNGNDYPKDGGGIGLFSVEYNILNGLENEPWEQLLPTVSLPGQEWLDGVKNDKTYYFMVTATDFSGNENSSNVENVSVDLEAPICDMDVPDFGGKPFNVKWDVIEDESGVDSLDVWIRKVEDGGTNEWEHANLLSCDPVNKDSRSTSCQLNECEHRFRCNANDTAENVGGSSPVRSVIIDNDEPETGEIVKPEPGWVNKVPFTVKWFAEDAVSSCPSGIQYTNMNWSNGSATWPWNETFVGGENNANLVTLRNIEFGNGVNGDIHKDFIFEGEEFWFKARGVDRAENAGAWNDPVMVTVDRVAPVISLHVEDQGENPVDPENLGGVTHINIISSAFDPEPPNSRQFSDIGEHTVWVQRTRNGITREKYPCGGDKECKTGLIAIAEADELTFWSEVTDKAGNKNITNTSFLSIHPLANFVEHDVLINLGSSRIVRVQIRNLHSLPIEELTVDLDGYDLAGFIKGNGDFNELEFTGDKQRATVKGLQAGGKGLLLVEVVSSEPGKPKKLNLVANADNPKTSAPIEDKDTALLQVRFPASFSGLSDWTVFLLIGVAVLLYGVLGRKPKTRGK